MIQQGMNTHHYTDEELKKILEEAILNTNRIINNWCSSKTKSLNYSETRGMFISWCGRLLRNKLPSTTINRIFRYGGCHVKINPENLCLTDIEMQEIPRYYCDCVLGNKIRDILKTIDYKKLQDFSSVIPTYTTVESNCNFTLDNFSLSSLKTFKF